MAMQVHQDRRSRYGAVLVACCVQVLIVLIFAGLGIVPALQDTPALSVFLVPPAPRIQEPRTSHPRVALHLRGPQVPPPELPPNFLLPPSAPVVSTDADSVPGTTNDESTDSGLGTDSRIGILRRVAPEYPHAAVERRAQGTTSLAILVNGNGHPGAVRVVRGSGDPLLDDAAVRAVQKWEFTAATSHSHVVPTWGRLDVNFNLTAYREQHPDLHAAGDDPDPVATLTAMIKLWIYDRENPRNQANFELFTPSLRKRLENSGPVRTITFLGVVAKPPDAVIAQGLRGLHSSPIVGWDEFEVGQVAGPTRWYCGVDARGQIQTIVLMGAGDPDPPAG
jgi:TonB family protein